MKKTTKKTEPSQLSIDGIAIEQPPGKDPKRVAAGKKAKRKGGAFERHIVNTLKDAGIEAKRGWWQSSRFARFKGESAPVVPDVMVDGFWLELGDGIAMDDYKKLDQAQRDSAGRSMIPVAITRRKGQRVIFATLSIESLFSLLAAPQDWVTRIPGLRVSIRFDEFMKLMPGYSNPEPAPGGADSRFSGGEFETGDDEPNDDI